MGTATTPTELPPFRADVPPLREADGGRTTISKAVSVSIVGTFLILCIGALYYARAFFLPVILSVLLTLILEPLVRLLAHRSVPRAVSVVLLVVILGAGFTLTSAFLSGPVSEMISTTPTVVAKLRERLAFLEGPLAIMNDAGREMQKISEGGSNNPQSVVVVQSGLLASAAGTVTDIGTTLGATLLLLVFLIVSGDTLRTKLVHTLASLSDKKRSLRVLLDIESEVSRYLLTISGINAGLGLCVGLAMAFFGMPNPVLWGIAAALLNFIPFVGSLLGELLVFAVAVATFPTLLQAAWPPLIYVAIALVEGSFVTPTILGRRLELNPVAILIFLSLTTWMWGLVGTIIGVPMLVVIKTFSGHFTSLTWLAEFLSGEIPATPVVDMAPGARQPED
jgi:predicted PurR-regulated permease PerM